MIGYYVHHQGLGHAHRATAITRELDSSVTGLSSLPRPAGWTGEWLQLSRDDDEILPVDVTAHGRLHWVPERSAGLSARMAQISRWISLAKPTLVVVDISVEVSMLCRLHGIPVVNLVLPGARVDGPHQFTHDIARRIIAAWPTGVSGMLTGVDQHDPRLEHVGAISRFDGRPVEPGSPDSGASKRVALLMGRGGSGVSQAEVTRAVQSTRGWTWTMLGADERTWVDDPWDVLTRSEVVVTHTGQNALAEIAAARCPAIAFPQKRPHDEQHTTAAALRQDGRWPVIALDTFPTHGWPQLLSAAADLDGTHWASWNDGKGAARAAAIIELEART